MPNLFQIGAGLLNKAAKSFAEVTVDLVRESFKTPGVACRRMNANSVLADELGNHIESHDYEFLFEIDDFQINGKKVKPKLNDVIIEGNHTYELLSLPGVGVWKFHNNKTCYLVFGKAVNLDVGS